MVVYNLKNIGLQWLSIIYIYIYIICNVRLLILDFSYCCSNVMPTVHNKVIVLLFLVLSFQTHELLSSNFYISIPSEDRVGLGCH